MWRIRTPKKTKVAKKELKREQKKKDAIVEYSSSTDSGSENEKPQRKNIKKGKETDRR